MNPFTPKNSSVTLWLCIFLVGSMAEAATPRAYVSVNGNDANTCNVPTTPCRTYTGAISQVTPGGEVIVLDSGTFGGGTIGQSVTINAPAGIVALSASPIVSNPGAGNVVVLRGLTVQSPSPGSGTGISQLSGALFVENTVVDGWSIGLNAGAAGQQLFVKGSIFRNQDNHGLVVDAFNTAVVAIEGSFFERNSAVGVYLLGGTGRVSNTVMTGNGAGAYVINDPTEFTFQGCQVSGNSSGLIVDGSSLVRLSASTITRNGTGLWSTGNGLAQSFGNNAIRGNTSDVVGAVIILSLQ
jgi:hypothetical protein